MKVIKNYSLAQAVELLNVLDSELGSVYIPESGIIKQYMFWYVPVVSGFEYLFDEDVLRRGEDLDLDKFILTDDPTVGTNFNIGTDINSSYIDISNNSLSTSVVDTELNNFINNISYFSEDVFNELRIGGNEKYPLNANQPPSEAVVASLSDLAKIRSIEVSYWDGSKNVSIPNPVLRIDVDDNYVITNVANTFKGSVNIDTEENVFFMPKELFQTFSFLMAGQQYFEGQYKVCVLFNQNLTISRIFDKPLDGAVNLEGLYLAYAPLDFFFKTATLEQLGAPNTSVWNTFLSSNSIQDTKVFRVFPTIDLTPLD